MLANESPFDITLSNASVAENNTANQVIGFLSTSDPDVGDAFTYSLASGLGSDGNASFLIEGDKLLASTAFNFENKSSYSLRVRSTDSGGLLTEKAFTVSVTNVNEAPADIGLSQSVLAASAPAGTTVGTLTTSDPDLTDAFTYSLVPGVGANDNSLFAIQGSQLVTTQAASSFSRNVVSVRIRATDTQGAWVEKQSAITVDPPASAATRISPQSGYGRLVQGGISLQAGVVYRFTCRFAGDVRQQAGDSIPEFWGNGQTYYQKQSESYSLINGWTTYTALMSVRVSGTYELKLAVLSRSFDVSHVSLIPAGGGSELVSNGRFVTDLSGWYQHGGIVQRVMLPSGVTLSRSTFAEDTASTVAIGSFVTTDADPTKTFTYTFVEGEGGNDNSSFAIVGNELRPAGTFDFESKTSYSVRIRSTGSDGLNTENSFAITVTNVNETAADIALSSTSIAENGGTNAVVGAFSTTDPDSSNTFTYTMVSGTGSTDNAAFNISGNQLRATASLDFETKSSYSVRVRTTDQGGLFVEKSFTITVTDVAEAPANIALSPSGVAENQPAGTSVGTLTTTDPDAGNTFTYTLVGGTGSTDNTAFSISGDSLQTTTSFDCEAKSSYSIRVRSTDPDGLFVEKVFTITIANINEAPTNISLSTMRVPENIAASATVATLSSSDPDVGDTYTYSLVPGEGSTDNANFQVVGGQLRTAATFAYLPTASYSIRIRSTDAGGLSTEKAVTLSVNNSPTDMSLSSTWVAENLAAQTTVGTFSTTDPNEGETFTYSLVTGTGSTDNVSFSISGGQLRTAAVFNYEVKSSYSIRVRTTDAGGLFVEKAFTVGILDANEAPTNITLSRNSFAENQLAGTAVATLTSTDPDVGQAFTYTLVSGTGSTDNASFSVSSNQLIAQQAFDREAKSSYSIRLRTTDSGGLWYERAVTITISNVNEPPTDMFLSGQVVAENAATGTVVGTFSAIDPDVGSIFTYSLVSGSGGTANATFAMSGNRLVTAATLDYESRSSLSIRVRATDSGGLFAEKIFAITVTDVAEPITLTNTSLAENSVAGTTVGRFAVADAAVDAAFTYSLVSGTGSADNALFAISGGQLATTAVFNFESRSSYLIRVRATDQNGLAIEKSFPIEVTDVNEPPEDISLAGTVVAENQATGAVVGTLSTTDVDASNTFTYGLVAGTGDEGNAAFAIVGGQLTTVMAFDFEVKNSYSIRVRSTDQGGLFTEKAFTVVVTDVNEAATSLSLSGVTSVLPANADTSSRIKVADITIGDDAIGTNAVTISGIDASSFEVDAMALYLRAGTVLDKASKPSYTVTVNVADATVNGSATLATDYTLTITSPSPGPFDISLSAASVAENKPTGITIGTFTSTGVAGGGLGTYSLVAGEGSTDNSFFAIVGNQLRTAASFNYEAKNSYSIRIGAADGQGITIEKEFVVTVVNVNEAPAGVSFVNKVATLPEGPGTPSRVRVADLVIADDDLGVNVFALSGADSELFEVIGSSLYLKAGVTLDYAAKVFYDVQVSALDATGVGTISPSALTLYYSDDTGNLRLWNTSTGSLAIESVWVVSPTQALSGSAAVVPAAAFTTLNTEPLGLHGLYSELFFANLGTAVLALPAGASWNLGNVAATGLSTSDLFSRFATEAESDPNGQSGAGKFLYGVVGESGTPPLARGSIVNGAISSFSIRVTNVPEVSGREFIEISSGQTVIDAGIRSGARQVIVRGGGRLILTGANTHSGGTRVESGELVIQNTAALGSGGLEVQSGATVYIDVGYGRVAVPQLTMATNARIDLGRGGLSIAAGGSTVASVRQYLMSARNFGLWDGFGIGSVNAKTTSNTAIGYRQQTLTSPIIVAWAAFGDINLDGRVNSTDVTALNSAKRYGLPSTFTDAHWYEGDFSYDGRVNSTDITFLNRWFNKGFYNTVIYAAAFSTTTNTASKTSISTMFVVTSATSSDESMLRS